MANMAEKDDVLDSRPTAPERRSSAPEIKDTRDGSGFITAPTTPIDPPMRKSVQIMRSNADRTWGRGPSMEAVPRKSSQLNRATGAPRPSRDFDNRFDGPFGRPSLTMARRRSSAFTGAEADSRNPSDPPVPSLPVDGQDGDEIAPNPEDLMQSQSSDPAFEPEPPPLNYRIWDRKYYTAMFWFLILVDCIGMPLALYFGLWYHTSLSPNAVFSIVTAALGGVSIVEYFLRSWRLWKKDSTCRVIGAKRLYFDWFHWNFTFGWVIIMIELIVGTVPENPPIRLLSMPPTSMLFVFGTELLIVDSLRLFQVPAPIRISSIPKGSQLRPCIYSVIEDVVSVDGSGGTAYREALNKRYEASHMFRAMLRRLGLFWAIGAETMAVVFTILIFTLNGEVAYCVGWAAPFVWAGIWTILTILYVRYALRQEKKAWAEELAEKAARA